MGQDETMEHGHALELTGARFVGGGLVSPLGSHFDVQNTTNSKKIYFWPLWFHYKSGLQALEWNQPNFTVKHREHVEIVIKMDCNLNRRCRRKFLN